MWVAELKSNHAHRVHEVLREVMNKRQNFARAELRQTLESEGDQFVWVVGGFISVERSLVFLFLKTGCLDCITFCSVRYEQSLASSAISKSGYICTCWFAFSRPTLGERRVRAVKFDVKIYGSSETNNLFQSFFAFVCPIPVKFHNSGFRSSSDRPRILYGSRSDL